MPAIITHDLFGKDVYGKTFDTIGGSRDAAEAFLLGNQGPDPLFFVAPDPRYRRVGKLASTLHRTRPAEFLVALKSAVRELPAQERSVGRAYALGYVCHYLLDSTVHPLVISQVNALCAAGVEGLTAEDAHEVHAVIETELDELVLTAKRGETVATYHPATSVLRGRDSMLDTVGRLVRHRHRRRLRPHDAQGHVQKRRAGRARGPAGPLLPYRRQARRALRCRAPRAPPCHDRGHEPPSRRARHFRLRQRRARALAPSGHRGRQPRQLLGSVRPGARRRPGRH